MVKEYVQILNEWKKRGGWTGEIKMEWKKDSISE